jgi:maltose O-acetyltransferase
MRAGQLYLANDPQLEQMRRRAKALCAKYNSHVEQLDRYTLAQLFGYATDAYLEPPLFCDYGRNTRLGQRVYANHNLVILDCALVTIGNDVMIGPNVVLSTATHPIDPSERLSGREYALPIKLGNGVWIGASVTVLPGVEIGDNTVIGAGSVVTRSIPSGVVAFGNPCRVIRHIETERSE